jgi:hypothetical protein
MEQASRKCKKCRKSKSGVDSMAWRAAAAKNMQKFAGEDWSGRRPLLASAMN